MKIQLTKEEKEIILRELNNLKRDCEHAIDYIENDGCIFKTEETELYPIRHFGVGMYHVEKLI